MSSTSNPQTKLPALIAINNLFGQARECEDSHNIREARKIEKQVAELVAEVIAQFPGTKDHADALATHEYVLLSLARTSKRKDVSKALRDAAYAQGAASVAVLLELPKPELGTVFAAYNLGIDLIVSENRPAEGLEWMLKSRALLNKLAGKKKLPRNILFFKLYSLDYGIAKAQYDLGQKKTACTTLKHALRRAPRLNKANWADLRGIAKCAELLAQIRLDKMDEARASKQAA